MGGDDRVAGVDFKDSKRYCPLVARECCTRSGGSYSGSNRIGGPCILSNSTWKRVLQNCFAGDAMTNCSYRLPDLGTRRWMESTKSPHGETHAG